MKHIKLGYGTVGTGHRVSNKGTGIIKFYEIEMSPIGGEVDYNHLEQEMICKLSFANINSLDVVIKSCLLLRAKMEGNL
jgi:hypothetical protein